MFVPLCPTTLLTQLPGLPIIFFSSAFQNLNVHLRFYLYMRLSWNLLHMKHQMVSFGWDRSWPFMTLSHLWNQAPCWKVKNPMQNMLSVSSTSPMALRAVTHRYHSVLQYYTNFRRIKNDDFFLICWSFKLYMPYQNICFPYFSF